MATSIPSRYRIVNFLGGRILEARELLQLQDISQGQDVLGNGSSTSNVEEQKMYRQGALLNATIVVSGTSVTISATNGSLPVSVFVRDRWETFLGTDTWSSVTLSGGQTAIYLNWQIVTITSSDDPTLVDIGTGNPTAEMGQLNLQISATDTSGAPGSGELYRNSAPIPICNFTYSSGVYTLVLLDNVNPLLVGNTSTSGPVKLTTGTSGGVAVSSDDSRLTNTRTPSASSVTDATVRTPISPGGTNTDGTTIYNLSSDAGGISGAKIILTATTQLLSDAWSSLLTKFNSLLSRYNAHEGIILGLSNTHPFPTASQVGCVPLSHVGLPLNLPTSHSATVNQSSGGFALNRPVGGPSGASMDPAYGVFNSSVLAAGLNHDGDIYSQLANGKVAAPAATSPYTISYSGPLGLLSNLATVVAEHVNQTSNANPHGFTLSAVTQNSYSSGSRPFSTTFQNTNSKCLLVVASGIITAGVGHQATIQATTGPGSPSTIVATETITNSDGVSSVYFLVLPGYYYRIDTGSLILGDNLSANWYSWVEWALPI